MRKSINKNIQKSIVTTNEENMNKGSHWNSGLWVLVKFRVGKWGKSAHEAAWWKGLRYNMKHSKIIEENKSFRKVSVTLISNHYQQRQCPKVDPKHTKCTLFLIRSRQITHLNRKYGINRIQMNSSPLHPVALLHRRI